MTRILVRYLRPYKGPLALVVTLLLVQSLANLYLPELNADIINNGVAKGDTGYIIRIGGLMLGVTVALGIASIIAVYWAAKVSMAFGRDLRKWLKSHPDTGACIEATLEQLSADAAHSSLRTHKLRGTLAGLWGLQRGLRSEDYLSIHRI